MTFDLTAIAIFAAAAVLYSAALPKMWRAWALLAGSVVAIYGLQPPIVVGKLDFAFPTATIAVTVALWWFTRPIESARVETPPGETAPETARRPYWRWVNEDGIALGVIAALTVGMAFMRYIDRAYRLTPSRPPDPLTVIVWLAVSGGVVYVAGWALRRVDRNRVLTGLVLLVIGVFVVLKTEVLALEVARFFREQTGRDPNLAGMIDLNWLGFSYVAFRWIHILRDRQSGKLPALTLREFVTYVIFFPAFTAGPIDRAERFVKDFRALPEAVGLDAARFTDGTARIMTGIFKKFVLADTLALGMALNATNADQTTSVLGVWALLYGYSLRLFLDFSGYTDIAIGVGILFGIRLPENFDRPYLKHNITVFWQSWHMTLSNWARFYVFTPFSRFLLTRKRKPSPTVSVLLCQMATMTVIGLWHGVTVNFVVWGVWHGVGLFIHKQWTDRTRKWYRELAPGRKRAWTVFGWFVTFHFVVLGWVWFALPDVAQSARVFGLLFGAGG